jgi:hypothetical protein
MAQTVQTGRSRTRRTVGDALISVGALAGLLLALVAVDDRVRQQVSLRFSGSSASSELMNVGSGAREIVGVVFQAAKDQSLNHAPLMIFVVAASVLTLFMLRT